MGLELQAEEAKGMRSPGVEGMAWSQGEGGWERRRAWLSRGRAARKVERREAAGQQYAACSPRPQAG